MQYIYIHHMYMQWYVCVYRNGQRWIDVNAIWVLSRRYVIWDIPTWCWNREKLSGLVVYRPLWKICSSVGIIIPKHSQYMENHKSHVPNHQPVSVWICARSLMEKTCSQILWRLGYCVSGDGITGVSMVNLGSQKMLIFCWLAGDFP